MSYTSQQTLDFPRHATLTDLLLEYNLGTVPADNPAIIDGLTGNVVYTHSSFRSSVKKIAVYFRTRFHIGRGAVVGLLAPNTVHYPLVVHGILACGATISALNPTYTSNELAHALNLARPSQIFVEDSLTLVLEAALKSSRPSLPVPAVHPFPFSTVSINRILLTSSESKFNPVKLSPQEAASEVAFICFSSGTTGLVKGVKLSQNNMVANLFQHRQGLKGDFDGSSVCVLVVPFFHILGLGVFACQYILQGIPIVIFSRFDFGSLLVSIKRDKVTHINVVPTIALEFLRNPLSEDADYSSVQCLINAAAPLKQELSDQIAKRVGCVITQWYGMTEASPSVISQRQDQTHIANSIGKLLPGIDMEILDAEGLACPPQVPGELCIRGPNIMLGYVDHDKPAAMVSNSKTNSYMRTGDIGYIDTSGYVYLIDRTKDMIKVKGNQVAPAELETILLSHPRVQDAAVKGIYSDHHATELPVAFISTSIPATDHANLQKELHSLVEQKVARYKRLAGGIHIIAQIPRNPSGKVLRRLLPDIPIPPPTRAGGLEKL